MRAGESNILLTGPPPCGKSTRIEKLVKQISRPVRGFFTREIREGGRRKTLIKILDSENLVIGSIAEKGGPFIQMIKERADGLLVTVTEKNRDSLVADLLKKIPV